MENSNKLNGEAVFREYTITQLFNAFTAWRIANPNFGIITTSGIVFEVNSQLFNIVIFYTKLS